MATRYYTLVASLPALPYFEVAQRVPLNRVRLQQRVDMLTPEDAAELHRVERLIAWRSHGLSAEASDIEEIYDELRSNTRYPAVLEYVEHRIEMRTVISALRARRMGTPLSALERPWGLGPLAAEIGRRWDAPAFGLQARLPWIGHFAACIEREDALELGRAVFEREWRILTRIADSDPFGFPAVLSFVMRRDIVERWRTRDRATAMERFATLTKEAFDEHARLHFD